MARGAVLWPLTALDLSPGLRHGLRSARIAVAAGGGFGLLMVLGDATLFHPAVPEVQRLLVRDVALGVRIGHFLLGAVADELTLRLIGLTVILAGLVRVAGRRTAQLDLAAIVVTAGVLWPLWAQGYLRGLDRDGLTIAREIVLHGGAGVLWGWLYCRHGWLAGVAGHGAAQLVLQPLLAWTV